jgi:hypothetical protein
MQNVQILYFDFVFQNIRQQAFHFFLNPFKYEDFIFCSSCGDVLQNMSFHPRTWQIVILLGGKGFSKAYS